MPASVWVRTGSTWWQPRGSPAETSSPSIFGQHPSSQPTIHHLQLSSSPPPPPTRPDLDAPDAKSLNTDHPPRSLFFPLLAGVSAGLPHPCLDRSRSPPFISLPLARGPAYLCAQPRAHLLCRVLQQQLGLQSKTPHPSGCAVASPANRPGLEPHLQYPHSIATSSNLRCP